MKLQEIQQWYQYLMVDDARKQMTCAIRTRGIAAVRACGPVFLFRASRPYRPCTIVSTFWGVTRRRGEGGSPKVPQPLVWSGASTRWPHANQQHTTYHRSSKSNNNPTAASLF